MDLEISLKIPSNPPLIKGRNWGDLPHPNPLPLWEREWVRCLCALHFYSPLYSLFSVNTVD